MATYGAGIRLDTSVSSATYTASGSGTVYTVPNDSYIIITSVDANKSVTDTTGFNFYVNGAKFASGTSGSALFAGGPIYAGPGHTISYDTTGGSGSVHGTVYFVKFFNS